MQGVLTDYRGPGLLAVYDLAPPQPRHPVFHHLAWPAIHRKTEKERQLAKGRGGWERRQIILKEGTVRSDWIFVRVVPLDGPGKGHQPLYVFHFLILILNFRKDFKVLSRFMQKGLQSSCLFGSRFACAQTATFFAELFSKNAGDISIVLWVAARKWRIPSFRNPN